MIKAIGIILWFVGIFFIYVGGEAHDTVMNKTSAFGAIIFIIGFALVAS